MALQKHQAHAMTGAAWLFGLAALFYTGWWWPGIMFVVGVAVILEGLVAGQSWAALQGGAWILGIGVWAMLNFQVWFLFVILGISALAGAFAPPPVLAKKTRPPYETELE